MYQDPERPAEPPEERRPTCPVCWEEYNRLYRSLITGEVLGCDCCVGTEESEEWNN